MIKQKKITIRMNEDLYEMAMEKCSYQFGISLSNLVKIFLRSFVSQSGVGFYVGDEDLCRLFAKWLIKKKTMQKMDKGPYYAGPYLKDLFKLNQK